MVSGKWALMGQPKNFAVARNRSLVYTSITAKSLVHIPPGAHAPDISLLLVLAFHVLRGNFHSKAAEIKDVLGDIV